MIEVYIVSAFSKNGTGGNKAGVVLQENSWTEDEKTAIAYQLGYSETAFVAFSEKADFKLEYFTPMGEVPLCGHATVGTFVVMNDLGVLDKASYSIETKSGILNISLDENGRIFMEQNTPQFYDIITEAELEGCFDTESLYKSLPVQMVSTGLKDILVPVISSDALGKLTPDFDMISRISQEKECVGIHAFSFVEDGNLTAICRNFAPLYGIDEEAATGTSNCALACYLYKYGRKQDLYIFEQGYNLDSVSRIYVKLVSDNNMITGVYVGGDGYLVSRRNITV